MTTLPVTCWPHRCRKSEADRFIAAKGPIPSKASTGTTMKVMSDQMAPPMAAVMSPAAPPRSRRVDSTTDTTADTSAHCAMTPNRLRATARAAFTFGSSPRSAWSAAAASATLK